MITLNLLMIVSKLLVIHNNSRLLFIRHLITLMRFFLMLMFNLYAIMNNTLQDRFTLRYRTIRLNGRLTFNCCKVMICVGLISSATRLNARFRFHRQFSNPHNNCKFKGLTFVSNYYNMNRLILNLNAARRPCTTTRCSCNDCNGRSSSFFIRVCGMLWFSFFSLVGL